MSMKVGDAGGTDVLGALVHTFDGFLLHPEAIGGFGLVILVFLLIVNPIRPGAKLDANFVALLVAVLMLTGLGFFASVGYARKNELADSRGEQLNERGVTLLRAVRPGYQGRTDLAVFACASSPDLKEVERVAAALNMSGRWGVVRYGRVDAELAALPNVRGATIVTDSGHAEQAEREPLAQQLAALGYDNAAFADNPGAASRWFVTAVICGQRSSVR